MSSLSSARRTVEYKGDPKAVAIDDKEINYLLNVYNAHFKKTLSRDDIVWTYSGVRPLCDDESGRRRPLPATIPWIFTMRTVSGAALSVGGKLTTYRKLAEHALEKLTPYYKADRARHDQNRGAPPAAISAATATTTRQNCAVASRSSVNHWPAIIARTYGSNTRVDPGRKPAP